MPLGLYLSVPFCRTKCSYCNFASDVFSRALFQRYVDRVCHDIERAADTASQNGAEFDPAVDSVYLGGGTPTVLDCRDLERLFVTIRQNFCLQPKTEITVECAPGTLSDGILQAFQGCGVNRVSLGVQSFVDRESSAVGRLHKRETVLGDITRLRAAGISNLNLDLIAGLPHQTAESWKFSLSETIACGIPHTSVYMLEVDDDSRLGRELIAGGTKYHAHFVPDEDLIAALYETACHQLNAAGIQQYEISNFARPGCESRHNLKYWTRQPYLGFGVDAHSMLARKAEGPLTLAPQGRTIFAQRFSAGSHKTADQVPEGRPMLSRVDPYEAIRFATPDALEQYQAGVTLKPSAVTFRDALEESFFLGLRLNRGVDLTSLGAAAHDFASTIAGLVGEGLLDRDGDTIRLTARGRLLSNEVFGRFITAAV